MTRRMILIKLEQHNNQIGINRFLQNTVSLSSLLPKRSKSIGSVFSLIEILAT